MYAKIFQSLNLILGVCTTVLRIKDRVIFTPLSDLGLYIFPPNTHGCSWRGYIMINPTSSRRLHVIVFATYALRSKGKTEYSRAWVERLCCLTRLTDGECCLDYTCPLRCSDKRQNSDLSVLPPSRCINMLPDVQVAGRASTNSVLPAWESTGTYGTRRKYLMWVPISFIYRGRPMGRGSSRWNLQPQFGLVFIWRGC